jgi:thiamine kinase-like enzyme
MTDKDIKIKELEELLNSERVLRGSEILMNNDLKEYNQKLEIQIEKLLEINQDFLTKIINLNRNIKKLSEK